MSGPVLLKSSLLPVPHAFTTRRAGCSAGIFASLNFGNPGELPSEQRDSAAHIRANFESVLQAIGCRGREVVEVHQVHGDGVHIVHPGKPAHPTPNDSKADALVTDDPTRVVAIRVADCAPVLLASRDGRVVAAVHAGWRGVIGDVVTNAVEAMRGLGAGEVVAAVGPCISVDHFEVGPEVASEFQRVFGKESLIVKARAGDRSSVDLKGAIRTQLDRAGVSAVDVLPHCTYAEPDRFFSHRRDRGLTGRMIGIIGANNPA